MRGVQKLRRLNKGGGGSPKDDLLEILTRRGSKFQLLCLSKAGLNYFSPLKHRSDNFEKRL